MNNFYMRLKSENSVGESKAGSLRAAALGLMNEPQYRHPFFWASYIMIGKG
jgi:CHAT domain-containing protein